MIDHPHIPARRVRRATAFAAVLGLLIAVHGIGAQPPASLRFENGRVYLTAVGVPLHDLLALWQREGGTTIVFLDRVPDRPVTLALEGVPEMEALSDLLKDATGFLARDRPAPAIEPDASRFAVLLVQDARGDAAADRAAVEAALRAWTDERAAARRPAAGTFARDEATGDPGRTPAHPGMADPPPAALPEGGGTGNPLVNPIPHGAAPPPKATSRPLPEGAPAAPPSGPS